MAQSHRLLLAGALLLASVALVARQTAQGGGRGNQPFDETRARQLYVSNKFEDQPSANFQSQIDAKATEDARYADACKGNYGVHEGHLSQQRW